LRCRLKFVALGFVTEDDCDSARSAHTNRIDFGIVGGGGIGWTIGGFTLTVEARASSGLRPAVLPIDVQSARSSGWSVLAGVSLPLYRARTLPPVFMPPRAVMPPPLVLQPAFVPPIRDASRDRLAASAGRRVTLTADNVPVRDVLAAIAKITGVKVTVSAAITTR